jgi:hypothetical protein
MSHFTLNVGRFFHFHPFDRGYGHPTTIPAARATPVIVPEREPSHSDDLAFFGLFRMTRHEDQRTEMARLSLTDVPVERTRELDETILFLL